MLLLDVNALLGYQPPTIGPMLGASFLFQAYYPYCRGSSHTGPMAVDRDEGTNDGV